MNIIKSKPSVNNLLRNIPFIVSGGLFVSMFAASPLQLIIAAAAMFSIIIFSLYSKGLFRYLKANMSLSSFIMTIYILAALAKRFCVTIIYSSPVQILSNITNLDNKIVTLFTAFVTTAAAFYFAFFICTCLCRYAVSEEKPVILNNGMAEHKMPKEQIVFLIITAFVTITICSKSSPVYPFNDWVDANCFLTVGKSMLYGKVPYVDLFEQKGPILYMIHAVAALISERSFLGIYFLEIAACAAFLYYSYKTIKLFDKNISIAFISLLSALVYSSKCFSHGDSAEELCLPFFTFALYVGFKSILNRNIPDYWECLAIGITSSLVLWIKFSMLGFYIGWIFVPAYLLIRSGKIKELFAMLCCIAAGVFIPSLFVLIYFGAHGAITDLWTVYFYDNLFFYTKESAGFPMFSTAVNLAKGANNILLCNFVFIVSIAAAICMFFKKEHKTYFCFFAACVLMTYLTVYIGRRGYTYYSLILSAFVPEGLFVIFKSAGSLFSGDVMFKLPHILKKHCVSVICLCSLIFVILVCGNTYMLKYHKSDLPQFKFAEIMSETDNPSLLNYGFLDGGFYTAAGIVPDCKYFCKLNIGLPEIMDTQDDFVKHGKTDYVVTRNYELEADLYEYISEESFYFEGASREYRLYKLKKPKGEL